VVKAVQDSQARIFISTPPTFFSVNDVWMYVEISDDKTCMDCHANAQLEGGGMYYGNHLRAFFPYLEILDDDTIKVNEHPNCRCLLVRVSMKE
jgi:hypothetical protein